MNKTVFEISLPVATNGPLTPGHGVVVAQVQKKKAMPGGARSRGLHLAAGRLARATWDGIAPSILGNLEHSSCVLWQDKNQ